MRKVKKVGSTKIVYFGIFTTDTTMMTMMTAITTPMMMRICGYGGLRK